MNRRQSRLALVLLLIAGSSLAAQKTRTISGTIHDLSSKAPLSGALVQLQNAKINVSIRSDEIGEFRLLAPGGAYQMSVKRIGYAPFSKQVTLPDEDSEVNIDLAPLAQQLAPVHVGANGAGIWGVVQSGALDRPMPFARVQLAGSHQEMQTDSAGSFFFDVKPGRYFIRIGRNGYATESFTIDVAKDQVADASTVLDKSDAEPNPGLEGLWKDLDQRLVWRGFNSALLSGVELRQVDSKLDYAISSSPAMVSKGIRLANNVCVFENGVPRPGFPIQQYRVENIEAIEVYTSKDDAAQFLRKAWPVNAPCSSVTTRPTGGRGRASETAQWVSIWTKRK